MSAANRIAFFLLSWLAFSGLATSSDPPPPDRILSLALEKAKAAAQRPPETEFQFKILRVSEKLDSDGSVKESERQLFRSIPMGDRSFERLVEEDGRPLPAERVREEDRRQREFAEKLENGEKIQESSDNKVSFDEELVAKYDFRLTGLVDLHGRPAYALAYAPKSGDLPVKRRMDRALNKAEGVIYVDSETYELARVEFELKEKVRIGWGIIGSISQLRGRVDRVAAEDGIWLPKEVEIYLDGRILFSSLHRREKISWSDFERVARTAPPPQTAKGSR